MKQLDHKNLQSLAKNTSTNKSASTEQSLDLLIALLDYQSNYEGDIRNNSQYDSANVLLADNNWMRRRQITTHSNQVGEGYIFKTDFSKAFKSECAYIHYSLCVRLYKNKALVIPTTSNIDMFAKAFHPADNRSGEYRMRRGKKSEGFSRDCTLYMNDAKYISLGRVIKAFSPINSDVLDEVKRHLLSICFPHYDKKITNLVRENEELKKNKEELEGDNNNLRAEIENLKNKLTNESV